MSCKRHSDGIKGDNMGKEVGNTYLLVWIFTCLVWAIFAMAEVVDRLKANTMAAMVTCLSTDLGVTRPSVGKVPAHRGRLQRIQCQLRSRGPLQPEPHPGQLADRSDRPARHATPRHCRPHRLRVRHCAPQSSGPFSTTDRVGVAVSVSAGAGAVGLAIVLASMRIRVRALRLHT